MADFHNSPTTHSGAEVQARYRRPKLIRAFAFAFEGLAWAWRCQPNFRLEALIGILALLAALWFRVNAVPILLCSGLVLCLELINSALEAVVDLASPQQHHLAKRAKDAAAAAVLLASLMSVLVGLWVLGPPLLSFLRGLG